MPDSAPGQALDLFLAAVTSTSQGDVAEEPQPRRGRTRLRRTLDRPHLDRPWREAEYCVIDYETTGLDLRSDDIISFGAVLVRQGRIDLATAEYELVRPRHASTVASFSVHALRDRDLAGATTIEHCAAHLARCLSGRILVAHAAWIESFLTDRALRSRHLRFAGPCVDTAALARRADLAPPLARAAGEPQLEALAGRLGLPVHTPHHALGDALTTAQLFLALARRLEDVAPRACDLVAASHAASSAGRRRPGGGWAR